MNRTQSHPLFGFTQERLSAHFFPILMAATVGFACLYTFHRPFAYASGVFCLLGAALLFRLFDRLKERKFGALIFAVLFVVTELASYSLVLLHASLYGYLAPVRWFYAQNDDDVFAPLLLAAMFIGGGFFLVSVIYYYTSVRFRMMGAMLCTMFPFVLFTKRFEIMPDVLTTLIVLLFLGIVIHNRRLFEAQRAGGQGRVQIDRSYILCIALFILVTGALTVAIEKPYYQAFLEKNSTLFNPFNLNVGRAGGYEDLSDQSSPRNGAASFNQQPLFYLETSSAARELFLRKQAFDAFNGEVWQPAFDKMMPANPFYCQERPEYGLEDIAADMRALTDVDTSDFISSEFAHVFDDDFRPKYLPAPNGVVTDRRPYRELEYYKDVWNTAVYRNWRAPVLNDSYDFLQPQSSLYDFVRDLNFSAEEYMVFLMESSDDLAARRLASDYRKALEYFTDDSNVSPQLAALAQQIVSSCHSEFEKALALERYFAENGYVYSLDYMPPDNSIDTFVFESKTGYCANYATAMTLMARAVGLPARYVEGFAAFERNESGVIVVRDSYAHAIVEVYIPGAGWLSFNPTVSGYRTVSNGADDGGGFFRLPDISGLFSRLSVVLAAAGLLLIFALLDRIKEVLLRLSLPFKPVNERICLLYANLLRLSGAALGKDLSAYTPDMLRECLLRERGVVPEQLIALFEKTAFGAYACSEAEYRKAYAEYRRCCASIRRAPKRQKGRQTL